MTTAHDDSSIAHTKQTGLLAFVECLNKKKQGVVYTTRVQQKMLLVLLRAHTVRLFTCQHINKLSFVVSGEEGGATAVVEHCRKLGTPTTNEEFDAEFEKETNA